MKRLRHRLGLAIAAALATIGALAAPANAMSSSLAGLTNQSEVASTVPTNGDLNPYGIALVPKTVGNLVRGDILVSNFNNGPANEQGRGSTIVEIAPTGQQRLFAQLPGAVGLTTALTVLQRGFVVVGSLPTSDGTSATATGGELFVLDSSGRVVSTLSGGPIDGPWDLTALDLGRTAELFVTNVLNGTVAASPDVVNGGTVVRITLDLAQGVAREEASSVIGSGFAERTDSAALVVGPTGLGLAHDGTLFVADTVDNRITAIPHAVSRLSDAGTGDVVTTGGFLNGPLGLAVEPNDDILTVNAGDGDIVETTPSGAQVTHRVLDDAGSPPGAGALFGLAVAPEAPGVYFVDDNSNTLNLLSR